MVNLLIRIVCFVKRKKYKYEKQLICGLDYKHVTIVNYDSSVISM
jgi:hypothetical protein